MIMFGFAVVAFLFASYVFGVLIVALVKDRRNNRW